MHRTYSIDQRFPEKNIPDGGWGWLIVFGSFMISFLSDGFTYTSGVFYEKFLHVYGQNETVTSIFVSVMTGMISILGPFASGLSQAYGCRAVSMTGAFITVAGMLLSTIFDYNMYCHAITLGFFVGLGLGLMYLPQIIIITEWFDRRLSFATGIAVCGTGFGIATFALMSDWLIEQFTWKGAMLILASLMFTNVFFSATFRKPRINYPPVEAIMIQNNNNFINIKDDSNNNASINGDANYCNGTKNLSELKVPNGEIDLKTEKTDNKDLNQKNADNISNREASFRMAMRETFNFAILHDYLFLYFLVANFIGAIVYYVPLIITSDRMIRLGFGTSRDGAWLMAIFGISNGFARTFCGYLSDIKSVNRVVVFALSVSFMGMAVAVTNFAKSYTTMQFLYVAFGVAEGSHSCLYSVVLVDLFGTERVYNTFGILLLFDGFATILGPPLTNLLVKYDDTYQCSIWLCSTLTLVSGFMLLLTPLLKRYLNKYKSDHNSSNGVDVDEEKITKKISNESVKSIDECEPTSIATIVVCDPVVPVDTVKQMDST